MEVINKKEAKEKGLKDFFTNVPCKYGHVVARSVANGGCRQCIRNVANKARAKNPELNRQQCREWYAKNKEHAKQWKIDWIANNRDQYDERRRRYRNKTKVRAKELLAMAKFSAKKKNISFDLDYEWIFERLELGISEMTGIKFDLEPFPKGRQNPYTASLDRVVPELGYVKSNVRMILWALNAAFNSYGENVYADIARVFLDRNPNVGTKLA
jgi:hypothetical protein